MKGTKKENDCPQFCECDKCTHKWTSRQSLLEEHNKTEVDVREDTTGEYILVEPDFMDNENGKLTKIYIYKTYE